MGLSHHHTNTTTRTKTFWPDQNMAEVQNFVCSKKITQMNNFFKKMPIPKIIFTYSSSPPPQKKGGGVDSFGKFFFCWDLKIKLRDYLDFITRIVLLIN